MKIIIGQYEASLYEENGGWTGAISLGFLPDGRRNRPKRKGKNKTEVKKKLKKLVDDLEKGVETDTSYTVAACVTEFVEKGLKGKSDNTHKLYRSLASNQIIPKIGRIKLKQLTADHVDEWLGDLATERSTETVRRSHNLLTRSIRMAARRDKVGRNVSALVDTPEGRIGRPSKSLTLQQAAKLIDTAQQQDAAWRLGAYVVLCLMSGIRTEEARALKWSDVDLEKATVYVLRAERHGGDTKTRRSRRGLAIAQLAVTALAAHKARQAAEHLAAGEAWQEHDLVFCQEDGSSLSADQVCNEFQKITEAARLGDQWVPRELRHTFVSLLSAHGVTIEKIADLVGHAGTSTTEAVYRHQLKPVITGGAEVMDKIFKTKSA
jgi:integrase